MLALFFIPLPILLVIAYLSPYPYAFQSDVDSVGQLSEAITFLDITESGLSGKLAPNRNLMGSLDPDGLVVSGGLSKTETELREKLFGSWLEFFRSEGVMGDKKVQKMLGVLRHSRRKRLVGRANCRPLPDCGISVMMISDEDDEAIKGILKMAKAPPVLRTTWPRFRSSINTIFEVHGLGKPPHYPIDAILHDPKTGDYKNFIREIVAWESSKPLEDSSVPLSDVFDAVTTLLYANDRYNAVRFKSLETAMLSATQDRARKVKWDEYKYSAIMIPGQGPEVPELKIAPLALIKMRRAVQEYRKPKTAPFIIVSGGTAHPPHTQINEAHEMREWLVAEYGLDPNEIVTEPYARHTTTNLRNTWRVLRQVGAPPEKPILVVADLNQLKYMRSDRFEKAAMRELGYLPCRFLDAPNDHAIEALLDENSHIIDPYDPMDP